MLRKADRQTGARAVIQPGPPLGRVYSVVRESWDLSDDPARKRPEAELMASDRTASEAADLARQYATAYPRHGYHKPSRSWWGVEGQRFHRFRVQGRRIRRPALVLGIGVAAIAAAAAVVRAGGRRK